MPDILEKASSAARGEHVRPPGLFSIVADAVTTALSHRRGPLPVPAVSIKRPRQEVYDLLCTPDWLTQAIDSIVELRVDGPAAWNLRLRLSGGEPVEWRIAIRDRQPPERIDFDLRLHGDRTVRGMIELVLAARGELTEVRVLLDQGQGTDLKALGKLLASSAVKQMLARFKQMVETGEVLKSDASIHAGRHPARPDDLGGTAAPSQLGQPSRRDEVVS